MTSLVASLLFAGALAPQAPAGLPENLVVDVRAFEARQPSPDLTVMHGLGFFIASDGTDVRANQWLSTLASKISEGFLAALRYDTVALTAGEAQVSWPNGARSFDVQIRPEAFDGAAAFRAQVTIRLKRGGTVLREFTRPVDLQMGKTTVWSSKDLELHRSDYLSHFREVTGSEERGQLYASLSRFSIFILMALTPRLAPAESPAPPETLSLPSEAGIPEIDNPFTTALHGKVVLGFELDSDGAPTNPQVLLSTVPEANVRVLGEATKWRFPGSSGGKRRGRLEVNVKVPAP